MTEEWQRLIDEMVNGSERALAKLISRVENRRPGWMDIMRRVYPLTGKARVIGITGAPGAGKSTLVDCMTRELANRGLTVGVVAVDPSSPFSGGALLGDRLRMSANSLLAGVFIRSMATRGMLGGLSPAARDAIKLIDAAGKDIILVETVGVGQAEVEVIRSADLVLVVCVPGMGDSIQAIKAGIMEIADIFVVNKADRDGADRTVSDIEAMLAINPSGQPLEIPVLKTTATSGKGVRTLVDVMLGRTYTSGSEDARRTIRIKDEILTLLKKEVSRFVCHSWAEGGRLEKAVADVLAGGTDPYSLVADIMSHLTWQAPD